MLKLLKVLFLGDTSQKATGPDQQPHIKGSGNFSFDIVGESHYQSALERICGGKSEEGSEYYCLAQLVPEPHNPHDRNAIAAYINSAKVGYISRQMAARMSKAMNGQVVTVDAVIVGGWQRTNGDEGHFGVKLDL